MTGHVTKDPIKEEEKKGRKAAYQFLGFIFIMVAGLVALLALIK